MAEKPKLTLPIDPLKVLLPGFLIAFLLSAIGSILYTMAVITYGIYRRPRRP